MKPEELRKLAKQRVEELYPAKKLIKLLGFEDANNAEFVRGFKDLNDIDESVAH